jgi:outer membrane protein assembly factor BamB
MNSTRKGLLFGMLIVMASSPAHAQAVSVAPTWAHPEAAVTVQGANFADSEAIDIYFDTVDTALLVSTSLGSFSGTMPIPAAAAPGTHYITAVGRRSGFASQTTLNVSTPWLEFGYGAGHLGWNPYENAVSSDNVAQLGVLWSVPMDGLGGTPAVSNGIAFVGTSAGLTALSTATGALYWTAASSDEFYASPAVVTAQVGKKHEEADTVYAVGYSGTVYSLAASSGSENWSVDLYSESGAASSPVVVAGIVYVASNAAAYSGAVYALQASSGNIQWTTALGSSTESSPTVANGTIYIGCDDNNLYALNAATGAVEWKFATGGDP